MPPVTRKSRRASKHESTLEEESEYAHKCPVCLSQMPDWDEFNQTPNRGLQCPSGHAVCTECVSGMVYPSNKALCGPDCIAIGYVCPLCRADCCVNKFHIMVLLKGRRDEALSLFRSEQALRKWVES